MELKLDAENGLFNRLTEEPPDWWKNLVSDRDIYIDIRKNNKISAYTNGGSILSLSGARKYTAEIHFEYIPLQKEKNYLSYEFDGGNIFIPKTEQIQLNNFCPDSLGMIKKRIKKFYPNNSEKGIQGSYVTENNNKAQNSGFFLDTEFQFTVDGGSDGRVDLVWIDLKKKAIALVELKTMSDGRLFDENNVETESIDVQLLKYRTFAEENSENLVDYYEKNFQIKKKLGLLPSFVQVETIAGYELLKEPILLVGDCSQLWINNKSEIINSTIKNIAHSCIYQGLGTHTFCIPDKNKKNTFVF